MRWRWIVIVMVLIGLLPPATSQARQFAGCADEASRPYGARYRLYALNGLTFNITVIGVGDFDPAITVLGADGEIVTCNDDTRTRAGASVSLPSITAPGNEHTASVSVAVPADQGRLDYEVIVTNEDGRNGEFVLIYDGAEIYGAADIDRFAIYTNDGQIAREVPLGVYVANIQRPRQALDPVITFRYGDDFEQVCRKSSSRALCDGDTQDLTGFAVSIDGQKEIALSGDDAMLFYEVGSKTAEFQLAVSSYQGRTFGPYILLIHSGTGYPVQG